MRPATFRAGETLPIETDLTPMQATPCRHEVKPSDDGGNSFQRVPEKMPIKCHRTSRIRRQRLR